MNSINWKLRIMNKATLISLISLVVAFIYSLLGLFNIVPPIGQSEIQQVLVMIVELLAALGVVVDPTTQGVSDSEQALGYQEPRPDNVG